MHIVKLIGKTPPCYQCKRAEQEVRKFEAKFPGQVMVKRIDVLSSEAETYGKIVAPAIVIDDELVANGKILTADQLERHIRKTFFG